jgi:hypothetical protein
VELVANIVKLIDDHVVVLSVGMIPKNKANDPTIVDQLYTVHQAIVDDTIAYAVKLGVNIKCKNDRILRRFS